jgi:hypothetical protein
MPVGFGFESFTVTGSGSVSPGSGTESEMTGILYIGHSNVATT